MRSPKRTLWRRHISATAGRAAARASRLSAQGIRIICSRGRDNASIAGQSSSPLTTNLNQARGRSAYKANTSGCSAASSSLPECRSLGDTFHCPTRANKSGFGAMVPFVSTSINTPCGRHFIISTNSACCKRGSPPVITKAWQPYAITFSATARGETSSPFCQEYFVSHQWQCKLQPAKRRKTAGTPMRAPSPCKE